MMVPSPAASRSELWDGHTSDGFHLQGTRLFFLKVEKGLPPSALADFAIRFPSRVLRQRMQGIGLPIHPNRAHAWVIGLVAGDLTLSSAQRLRDDGFHFFCVNHRQMP